MEHLFSTMRNNWRDFKNMVEREGTRGFLEYYFVYLEDYEDSYIFDNQLELDEWLTEMFWDSDRLYDGDLENSMSDVIIWKLVSESSVKTYDALFPNAKKTSIIIDGESYYRNKIEVSVNQTVEISTGLY